jgi:hypothetical protein
VIIVHNFKIIIQSDNEISRELLQEHREKEINLGGKDTSVVVLK